MLVQAGNTQGRLAHIDADDLCAARGHAFREQATATTHIDHLLAGKGCQPIDIVKP